MAPIPAPEAAPPPRLRPRLPRGDCTQHAEAVIQVEEALAACEGCTVHGGARLKRCISMSTRRDSGVTKGRRNNTSQNQLAGPSNGSRRGVRRIGSIQEGPADSWAHVGPWAAKDD